MSKNKKKNKKGMSPETKGKIALGFKTLISNDACIQVGREWHWYLPVIFAILSVIIALVPSFTINMQTKVGTSMLGSQTYGYENGLVHFQNYLEEKNIDFVIKDSTLTNENATWEKSFEGQDQKWFTAKNSETSETTFEVFFNNTDSIADNDFYSRIIANKNPYTDVARSEEKYGNSVLILGKENVYLAKAKADGSSLTSASGIYDRSNGLNLKNLAPSIEKNTLEYTNQLKLNWANFVNDCAETQKNTQSWTYCGIMATVYVGLQFLFGLVIFLMTRGKRNPFRIYTFWETQKMAYWASISPAILSLAIGFMISRFALFAFIFLFGLRIMWMSMRSLRPYNGK